MLFGEKINKLRFNLAVQKILNTPKLDTNPNGPTVLSMVHHRDVLSYLLALKSFSRYVLPSRVVVVADPTITEIDRNLLRKHVPSLVFRDAAEFHTGELPQGGCWERLIAISEYASEGFVIQIDADTVASGPMGEVQAAIKNNQAFLLGTEDVQQIQICSEVAAWAQPRLSGSDHVQLVAESMLGRLADQGRWRYVRACAGFAGFPERSLNRTVLLKLSQEMGLLLGSRWWEWGTEQFSSNLLLASMDGATVLPHPKYCAPHRANGETVFRHFIGYVRHVTPLYAVMASKVASELRGNS